MGARALSEAQSADLAAKSFSDDGRVEFQVLGQSCVNLGALAGFESDDADKVLLAPLPSDLDALAAHPFLAEKLMPVLGVVRSPSVEHGDQGLRARHRARRARPHLGRVRHRRGRHRPLRARHPDGSHPGQRPHRGRSAGRRLQLDDADVLARLRHVGRLEHDRQRQLPQPVERQGGLAPADAAAVVPRAVRYVLQPGRAREPAAARVPSAADRHRRRQRGARRRRRDSPAPGRGRRARVLGHPARADRGADPRRRERARTRRRRRDHRGRRWLGHGCRQGDAPVPREPATEHPRAVAAVPRRTQANRLVPPERPRLAAWWRSPLPQAPARRSRRRR